MFSSLLVAESIAESVTGCYAETTYEICYAELHSRYAWRTIAFASQRVYNAETIWRKRMSIRFVVSVRIPHNKFPRPDRIFGQYNDMLNHFTFLSTQYRIAQFDIKNVDSEVPVMVTNTGMEIYVTTGVSEGPL